MRLILCAGELRIFEFNETCSGAGYEQLAKKPTHLSKRSQSPTVPFLRVSLKKNWTTKAHATFRMQEQKLLTPKRTVSYVAQESMRYGLYDDICVVYSLICIILLPFLFVATAKDIDGVLTAKRLLCFGATSIADVTSAGLLVAKGKNLAYLSLGDGWLGLYIGLRVVIGDNSLKIIFQML